MSGIVYFIQPSEFISSDIYKIGYSKQPLLNRIKQYGSKTLIKCIFESSNVINTEKKLISKFNEKFVKFKGKEYFICKDVAKAKNIFYEVCNSHYATNDDSDSTIDAKIDADIDTSLDADINADIETSLETNLKTKEMKQLIKIKDKLNKLYECDECKYVTFRRSNMITHKESKRHQNNIKKTFKVSKHVCKLCNYQTNIISHYKRHLKCAKHIEKGNEIKDNLSDGSMVESEYDSFEEEYEGDNITDEANEITNKEIKEWFCVMQGMFSELIKSNQQLATIVQNGTNHITNNNNNKKEIKYTC